MVLKKVLNMQYDDILQCPISQDRLKKCENCYFSPKSGHKYYQVNGFFNFLPKVSNKFREIEEKFWDYTYTNEGERDIVGRNAEFHKHFRQPLINLPKDSLVLEIACGNRADSLEIAQAGKKVIATDISSKALQLASSLAKKMNVDDKITFIQADAEYLPFADNSFDGVLISAAFHHLENSEKGLAEMKRVVKGGGYIILGVEPNSWPYQTIYKLLTPLKKYIRTKRQRNIDSIADDTTKGFSRKDLKNIFQQIDLEILEIRPVKYSLEFYDSYIRLKERLMNRPVKVSRQIQQSLSYILS